ncbi:MAG: hypothetical protein GX493_06725, partial [Firmicutes bacterium]|nr:hypothetical protein [Bacillota bacterium]
MTVGSSKEMMKPMEEELSIYNERIKKIFGWHVNISSLVKQMPAIPLDYEPSHRGLALIRISLFLINCIESALQAMKAIKRNWEDNN